MEFTTGIEQTTYKKVHKVRQNKGKKPQQIGVLSSQDSSEALKAIKEVADTYYRKLSQFHMIQECLWIKDWSTIKASKQQFQLAKE